MLGTTRSTWGTDNDGVQDGLCHPFIVNVGAAEQKRQRNAIAVG